MIARVLAGALLAGLAACAGNASRSGEVAVREVGRSAFCNTPDAFPRAQILSGSAAVAAWQARRGIQLVPAESIKDRPHVLVELGPRPTGGYGLVLDPRATIVEGRLAVVATLNSPGPGAMVSQALTSPCALGELEPGPYHGVEVRDAQGAVWIAAPPGNGSAR